MSQNVEAVIKSVRCLRGLYSEIAEFLRTFDSLMDELGYPLVETSKDLVVDKVSRTLSDPGSWLPVVFSRDYIKTQTEYFTVNVILHSRHKKNKELSEPFLLCCKICFAGRKSGKQWIKDYWSDVPWDLFFHASPENKEAGVVYSAKELFTKEGRRGLKEDRDWSEGAFDDIKDVQFAFFPLLQLNSRNEIKNIVLKLFGLF